MRVPVVISEKMIGNSLILIGKFAGKVPVCIQAVN